MRRTTMRSRGTSYVIIALAASVLALIPAALWTDMLVPMKDNWNNWYWKGQPFPRPQFTLQNPPGLFRAEVVLFKSLAIPPAYVHRLLRGTPTDYAVPWVPPYLETAGFPPLASTLQHVAWAVPFWFSLGVAIYELSRWLRSRRPRAA
jgi:hypothetical protein